MSASGVICLDKPGNITSFSCCAVFRRLLKVKKIGHAGTLDPMATGVLPLMVGSATRALDLLPAQDKRYTAGLRFGYVSDTQDVWGKVEATGIKPPKLGDIEEALSGFRGNIKQIPPMMSAVKVGGVRLYKLAHRGIEIERDQRSVTVFSIDIIKYDEKTGELELDCHCSKGTYIRALCADLGCLLKCGAVMISLRRTMASGFTLSQCVTLDEARELARNDMLLKRLMPVESVFGSYNRVIVTEAQARRFQNGGALALERLSGEIDGITRVNAPDGSFIGLGIPKDGQLKVLKLF